MPRLIFHIDMDSFFASVEKRDRPELRDGPLIIGADPKGGSGRGVVSTCCYMAREFGVHSAMPVSKAYRLCPQATFLFPDMEKYKEVSRNLMRIFASFADRFQPVSVDEAFLEVSSRVKGFGTAPEELDEGDFATPRELAYAIKRDVSKKERLTCSIGMATCKSVAKIASDMEKPNGITEVKPGEAAAFLAPLPVKKISGIGRKSAVIFARCGIETVGQLADASVEFLREKVGDYAVGFKFIAMGVDDAPVAPYEGIDSISRERTFMEDVDDEEVLMKTLRRMAKLVHRNALREQVRFRTIGIKVRTADFTTCTRERSMPVAVNTFSPIMETVRYLWMHEFSPPPQKIRLLGVRLSGLESGGMVQTTLDRWIAAAERDE